MTILASNDVLLCPHCSKAQEGIVDDYVIPGRTGAESSATDSCGYCDGVFSVTLLNSGLFEVLPEEDEEE